MSRLKSLRWRVAVRLLGYVPMRRPEKDGAYILWVDSKGGYRADVMVAASSLKMELTNSLPSFADLEALDLKTYRAHSGPRGTFTGTIGEAAA